MKKNLISIIILALLIVNIVISSIMLISVMSTNQKTADLVGKIASAISLEIGEDADAQPVVSIADTQTYTISDIAIELARGDGEADVHYASVSVTLSMDTTNKDYETYGDLSTREDLIKGVIFEVVGGHTDAEIRENQQVIKDEILREVQALFDSNFIYDVTWIINIM